MPSEKRLDEAPPAYFAMPSTPGLEKADLPTWSPDIKESPRPASPRSVSSSRSGKWLHRIITFGVLATAALLYGHLFFSRRYSRSDFRGARAYVSGYLSSSEWDGPTESLCNRYSLRAIWWRLRHGRLNPSSRPGSFWDGHSVRIDLRPGKPHAPSPAEAEELFLAVPNNNSVKGALFSFTGYSHLSGTSGDERSAMQIKNQWEDLLGLHRTSWEQHVYDAGSKESREMLLGSAAHMRCCREARQCRERNERVMRTNVARPTTKPRVWTDRYYSLLTFPQPGSSVALYGPSSDDGIVFNATLAEDPISKDPTAKEGSSHDPPFHGFSFPGSAEGELVYANMGTIADYDALEEAGVDLNGKIVIVRYGGIFRGLKVAAAEKKGAAGVIIYTDPAEDHGITVDNGYAAYPDGPARQPSSLQRGSVQALSFYPGDPLTPGKPAYKDAKRLSRDDESLNIPRIPSVPMSGKDAKVFLESLEGKGKQLGKDWRGGFGDEIGYWTGPGNKVKLYNDVKDNVSAIWNTYALIPGHISDEVVILGNHRDAWAFGAADPNSGTATVNEIVKGLGVLIRKGWRPLRTILVASWDGEELGLIGSTEFVEDYEEWLGKTAVAYLNVDVAVAGSQYDLGASPSLAPLFVNVSAGITSPDPEKAALGETLIHMLARGEDKQSAEVMKLPTGSVQALGSGSDFTPFLQHVGIASGQLGFRPGKDDPIYHYHSIYDSGYWMETFGDPGFHRHVAVAQALGVMALRFADSVVLPIQVSTYAQEMTSYLQRVKELIDDQSKLVHSHAFSASALDFVPLEKAIHKLQTAAAEIEAEANRVADSLSCLTMQRDLQACHNFSLRRAMRKARKINKRLSRFEGGFIDPSGLPQRPWYRSLVQAPGRWLGYGATPFPGLTEAITIDRSLSKASDEAARLTKALQRTAKALQL